MDLFKKDSEPLLQPLPHLPWADGAIFNPGACFDGTTLHLLFRAIPSGYQRIQLENVSEGEMSVGFDNYVSYIGYASSENGRDFDVRAEPLIAPDSPFDSHGAEDPRLVQLEGTFYITYSALQSPAFDPDAHVRVALASTRDFVHVTKHGVVGPDARDKDAVLFPELVDGRVAMLHRIVPNIQLIYFEDMGELEAPPPGKWAAHMASLDDHVILAPSEPWEVRKIGAGPPPIATDEGWLLLYHGVDANHVYRGGLALLDLDDPTRVVSRLRRPVLEPELDFEVSGDVNNVVFPEGAAIIGQTLHVYYGAADRVIGHATASLSDVLAALREEPVHAF